VKRLKIYWVWATVVFAFLAIGLPPSFWLDTKVATLYYGWLFFAILLGTSVGLLFVASPHPMTKDTEKQERDHRVVHYTLRVSCIFAVGALIVAILLSVYLIFYRCFCFG